jgi:hypothetical protein
MGSYTQWTVCDRGLSRQPTDQVGSRRPAGRLSSGGQFCGDRLLGTARPVSEDFPMASTNRCRVEIDLRSQSVLLSI